jgi:hypothetical protein
MTAEESPDRSVPIGIVLSLPSVAALFERHYDGEQVRQYQQQLLWERQQPAQPAQQGQEAHLPHQDVSQSASASASSVSLSASSAHPLTDAASLPSAAAPSSASASSSSSSAILLAALTIARARTVVRALFNSSLLEIRPADPQTNEELQARVSE